MFPPKDPDRVRATGYREVVLGPEAFIAVLPVATPEWWRDEETVVVIKVIEQDGVQIPVSCALTRNVF